MIKRTESETPSKKRRSKKAGARSKRRMMMEGLEPRQLLAGGGVVNVPLPAVDVPTFNGPRNIGTVVATPFIESELNNETGVNDTLFSADVVPLGTAAGQNDTIDLTGSVSFEIRTPAITLSDGTIVPATFDADVDTFAVDLRAGDILDIATLGAVSNFTVLNSNGSLWFGVNDNQAVLAYPPSSPLQTTGNAVFAQVVPQDGRYYISVAPDTTAGSYTLGLRAYRPVVESLPIGSQQIIFLDLDGTLLPASALSDNTGVPQPGVIRYPGLQESLNFIGVDTLDTAAFDRFLNLTLAEIESHFDFLGLNGNAGDFDRTGVAGDYGVTILNSRDHADPGNNALVTRVYVGGASAVIGGNLGISTTLDVGNFGMNDIVFATLEGHLIDNGVLPISNTLSPLETTAQNLAFTISHEAAHSFGMRHTDSTNQVGSLIDEGGNILSDLGVGNDGILGTLDDVQVNFVDDTFSLAEGIFGTNFVTNSLANTLVTGTLGGSITGRVFNDVNRDGNGNVDAGLSGVTVFADLDGDGIQDASEPTSVSAADGSYTLSAAGGTFNIIAITPSQFAASTPLSQSASFAVGSSISGVDFGFTQVVADITGTKFADLDGDGIQDAGEPGIGGVYIYLDLDGDDRPDLGEPAALSGADGTYSINFPGTGTYTIREVVEPGFVQTYPVGGEHTVFFDGSALTDNYNFGNLPSRDFGDAPDSYRTLEASGGPAHGLLTGLSLGSIAPDRELNGVPSDNAQGDDTTGNLSFTGAVVDDEDGVVLLGPLGPGGTTDLQVSVTNDTGTAAFLQAWMDFNLDGDFDDAGEQFVTDMQLSTGTYTIPVTLPATAAIGTTFARFRYSQTSGLGFGGNADTGEVEDYSFPILAAAEIANNDDFSVSRNSLSNSLNVLGNDFQTADNQLSVTGLIVSGSYVDSSGATVTPNTRGTVTTDGTNVFYTPPNGFIGRDVFGYSVRDSFNRTSIATVSVNVTFQTTVPIAVDDSFDVPQGSNNRALNVLDNDVPSIFGGLTITSVTPGTQGGTIAITGGGQSLRYTPLPGFNGTEQFTYSIQDSQGSVSNATVTVNANPGARADDAVDFTLEVLDTVNQQPISNVQVGDEFDVRVYVEDITNLALGQAEGVASAFLDLLYTDELVATTPRTDPTSPFAFDISFGALFGGFVNGLGNAQTPGLLDEIGTFQTTSPSQQHTGRVELLTVRMQAVSPGIAVFQGDPANNAIAETILVSANAELPLDELRFGSTELVIFPNSTDFSSAIDDSFPDGRDSLGNVINAAGPAELRVLDNDNLGASGVITERGLVSAPGLGTATFNDNGTPGNLNDDFINYTPNINASGFDEFTYLVVTADGIRSTAKVSLAVGNAGGDDRVALDFALVDESGSPITSVNVGQRFGVQVLVEDLTNASFVFAAYLDLLYDNDLISPTNVGSTTDNLDFDVTFDTDPVGNANEFDSATAVGTAVRPGIIDEFGSELIQAVAENQNVLNPNILATIFFTANAAGTTSVVGGPADSFPFQDTLVFGENDPIPVDQVRYDVLNITINGGQGELLQNPNNPNDVNDDGVVSPLDALLLMNTMANPDAKGESVSAKQLYLDVTGDGELSPLDVLRVLNGLAIDARLKARGEFVSDLVAKNETNLNAERAADSVFATLEDRQLTTDAPVISDTLTSPLQITDADHDGEEDEKEVLNLLADDISDLGL